ncbi:MAG TPA: circadian clock protein KaiC [Terriglobales bacterium]|nr:circadian clock protein KaiC [Terriglobales bacterium]
MKNNGNPRIKTADKHLLQQEFVRKTPTGTEGLDEVTRGGIPTGRNTLVCGGAGSGKTLFAMKYLLCGALEYGEPGLCISFEENAEELAQNMASLGYDLAALEKKKLLVIDHVQIARHEFEETGEYDLSGLFVRIEHGIRSIGAKRLVLDTVEVLFTGLPNEAIVRSELRRLFRWLKEQGVTTIITAESGPRGSLTRHGLEEYVADCVILLDHRVSEQVSTRRLRIVKYRGSAHGTNEFPFLLDESGLSVVPITSVGLTHQASTDRVSSGIPGLDRMLGGKGFFRNSSILISGTAGTGKSSFAAHFANATAKRGERCLCFAFEESPSQILRNMRSVGLDLEQWMDHGLLRIEASRPTSTGLEGHLARMHRDISAFKPAIVVVDPITNLVSIGDSPAVKSMLTRLIDFLKMKNITAMFTNLTVKGMVEETSVGISSLMDTWILLREMEILVRDVSTSAPERQRAIHLLKSRGMAHSRKMEPFEITDSGIHMLFLDGRERNVEQAGESRWARKRAR